MLHNMVYSSTILWYLVLQPKCRATDQRPTRLLLTTFWISRRSLQHRCRAIGQRATRVLQTTSWNKPTIPAARVQSNWTESNTTAADYILNKPLGTGWLIPTLASGFFVFFFFFFVTGKMSTLCQLTLTKIPDKPKLCETPALSRWQGDQSTV